MVPPEIKKPEGVSRGYKMETLAKNESVQVSYLLRKLSNFHVRNDYLILIIITRFSLPCFFKFVSKIRKIRIIETLTALFLKVSLVWSSWFAHHTE